MGGKQDKPWYEKAREEYEEYRRTTGPDVLRPRRIDKRKADAERAGLIDGAGTTGGGSPGGSVGEPPTGRVPEDTLDDTVSGIGPAEKKQPGPDPRRYRRLED